MLFHKMIFHDDFAFSMIDFMIITTIFNFIQDIDYVYLL